MQNSATQSVVSAPMQSSNYCYQPMANIENKGKHLKHFQEMSFMHVESNNTKWAIFMFLYFNF